MTFKFIVLGLIVFCSLAAILLRRLRLIRPLTAFAFSFLIFTILLELFFYREFDELSLFFGVENSADLLTYLSIPVLFILILKLYVNQVLNVRRVNRIITELALEDARKTLQIHRDEQ